jgi:outer membrane protein assembly factor BamE
MRYVFILLTIFLTACGTAALPTIKPYKLDVQQGNVVNSKMLLQLRPGMTKSQVLFVMGTPLVQDSFHGNRWDYAYQLREAGKLTAQRRVILDFENELLKTVRGDVIASTGEEAKTETANIGTRVIEPQAKAKEKSLLGKLKFWDKDDAAIAQEAADIKAKAAAAETAKSLPPLAAENAIPVTPSILAVPLVVEPALESTAIVAADESAAIAVPEAASGAATMLTLKKVTGYESSLGMRFERTLRSVDAASSTSNAPHGGDQAVPTPADSPAAAEPSLVDRMLEKIGF